MNKQQNNHFRMFLNTQEFLDSQTTVWSTINRISVYKNDFDEIISRIYEKSNEAEATIGITERKTSLRKALAVKVSSLSGVLQAFEYDKGDVDLANKVKATKTDVEKMREQEVDDFVKSLTNEATANLTKLADFGITEATITELLTTLSEFNTLIGKPRSILNSKYVALDTLELLIDEGNVLLKNKMDKIMMMFAENNPEFYNGYNRARTIVDN